VFLQKIAMLATVASDVPEALRLYRRGVAMLSSVRRRRAIKINIAIMRTFVRLRQVFISQKDLARKLHEIEQKLGKHDHNFQVVFEAIRQLMHPPVPRKRRRIGFRLD
jgi:hypothetical protein